MGSDYIDDSAIPRGAGIITFEMIYRAVEKVRIRIASIEKRMDAFEAAKETVKDKPKEIIKEVVKIVEKEIEAPPKRIDLIGKEIKTTSEKVKK